MTGITGCSGGTGTVTSVKLLLVSALVVHRIGQSWLPGTDLQTTVGFVTAIDGHPGGDTGARLHAQVIVVLMKRLAAGWAA